MDKQQSNEVILIACSATSHDILAALAKPTHQENYTTAEVCLAQALTGLFALAVLNMLNGFFRKSPQTSG